VLLALSRPSRPITRSQSQVTLAGEEEEEEEEEGTGLLLGLQNSVNIQIWKLSMGINGNKLGILG